jgi:hypothetical protein
VNTRQPRVRRGLGIRGLGITRKSNFTAATELTRMTQFLTELPSGRHPTSLCWQRCKPDRRSKSLSQERARILLETKSFSPMKSNCVDL